jgi:hypothetical protein
MRAVPPADYKNLPRALAAHHVAFGYTRSGIWYSWSWELNALTAWVSGL